MWLTALVIGFAGSMHCLGMCSPLVMAVTSLKPAALVNRIIYNSGRILTYGVMGAAVASAGMVLPLERYQNFISIILGVVLVIAGVGGLQKIQIPALTSAVGRLTASLKSLFAKYLKQKTRAGIFILGTLNGMLPCGLTFLALTWCLTLKGPLDGFNFMLIFGAGTLPVMLGLTGFLPVLVKKLDWSMQKMTTSMLILSGCILIGRVFLIHAPHALEDNRGLIDIMMCR